MDKFFRWVWIGFAAFIAGVILIHELPNIIASIAAAVGS